MANMNNEEHNKLQSILNADPLFDDKELKKIVDNLSKEDKERYEKIGKEMYDSINFDDINSQGNSTDHEKVNIENVAQLRLMLQSGIHPSYLNNQEKDLLKNNFGDKWYEEYGFLEVDLNRINF